MQYDKLLERMGRKQFEVVSFWQSSSKIRRRAKNCLLKVVCGLEKPSLNQTDEESSLWEVVTGIAGSSYNEAVRFRSVV